MGIDVNTKVETDTIVLVAVSLALVGAFIVALVLFTRK